ncbi:hypothetical protein CHS0354_023536 [Potamilus streckersoni]|uniref:Uncharacterized protein n=1 Tax=Potamilus streckersoni TaxID=2493646 RepID=A0AAE0RV99_9BIVA|nr:hypothetical protein CHS0354_023536 [Potamilus streckersoni]
MLLRLSQPRRRLLKLICAILCANALRMLLTAYQFSQEPPYPVNFAYRSDQYDYTHLFLIPNKSEVLNICVMAGYEGVEEELEVLLKSVILNAHLYSVVIYIISGDGSRPLVEGLINNLHHPYINIKYELIDLNKTQILLELEKINIAITYHAGIYGLAKAYLHRLLPFLDKCIILDTDLIFGSDPAFLWEEFHNQAGSEIITMKINTQTTTQFQASSGVVLMNFKAMREIKIEENYAIAAQSVCQRMIETKTEYRDCALGDQTLLFGVYQIKPYLFHSLPGSWILEFCHGFLGFTFDTHYSGETNLFFGIAHFNCVSRQEHMAFRTYVTRTGNMYFDDLKKYVRNIMNFNIH